MEASGSKESVPSLSSSTSSVDLSSSSQRTSSFEDVIEENAKGKDRVPLDELSNNTFDGGEKEIPIGGPEKGKDNHDIVDDQDGVIKLGGGVKLVKEGDEITEESSSILAFLNAFPRIVLRSAQGKFVFVKGGLRATSTRIKATCTYADLVNDHKAGQELFKPEWYDGADGARLLALKTATEAYWSVEKKDGTLSLANVTTPRETELFVVELLSGGSGMALKSCLQTYVGLNPKRKNKKSARLVAVATAAGDYETFYVSIKCGLLLASSDFIVSATKLGRFSTDNRDKLHRWECFLIQATGNCCTISSSHKRHLTAETSGQILIEAKDKGSQQLFALVPASPLTDWKYYVRTWYNCYLRCEDIKHPHAQFVADVMEEKEASAFQVLPLGVPADELKLRSQNLSSSINALQTTLADEVEEVETEAEQKEEKQDKEQIHAAIRGRSDTTLAKLTESLKSEGRRTPSMVLREHLLPGENVVMRIESMAHLVTGRAELGTIFVTNMHIIYNPQFAYNTAAGSAEGEEGSKSTSSSSASSSSSGKKKTTSRRRLAKGWKVGLGYIDYIESTLDGKHFKIDLYCKDFNVIQLSSLPGHTQTTDSCKAMVEKLQELCFRREGEDAPSYILKKAFDAQGCKDDGWNLYDPQAELERLGFGKDDDKQHWRITDANNDYALCKTYPRVLAVPASFSDEQLKVVAEYRSRGRLQSVVWRHPATHAVLIRCSQPRRGLKMATCHEDELYVESVRQISKAHSKEKEPHIQFLDARPRVNAFANQLNGAGTEDMSNYKRCKRKFLGIGNIHVMRSALYKVEKLAFLASEGGKKSKTLLETEVDYEKWLGEREETLTWLEFVALILSSAKKIVRLLERGTSIIFHCSDGWDRTAQVCGLAELLIDPYFRTKRGFAILVEKEWLSYGHKFEERIGHKGRGEKDKERSPIFFQWLESVYQLLRQFPSAFEFNEKFLLDIQHATYSCLYGTFLCNSEYERYVEQELPSKSVSLWSNLLHQQVYNNPTYDERTTSGVLDPSSKNVKLWAKAHFPFLEV